MARQFNNSILSTFVSLENPGVTIEIIELLNKNINADNAIETIISNDTILLAIESAILESYMCKFFIFW